MNEPDMAYIRLFRNTAISAIQFCLILFCICLNYSAARDWTSCSGPTGVTVNALAIDPQNTSTLYAETDLGGVFKSAKGFPGKHISYFATMGRVTVD